MKKMKKMSIRAAVVQQDVKTKHRHDGDAYLASFCPFFFKFLFLAHQVPTLQLSRMVASSCPEASASRSPLVPASTITLPA